MQKSVLSGGFTCALLLFPLLSFIGCYSSIDAGDGSDEKAIAIDWVDPPCAEPGSEAGYIEGNGFGAENVTVTVGGIEAEVLAATGMDASFVVPEGLEPGPVVVVVENPGGRLATIDWRVCEIECDPPDCDDGDPCTDDSCDPIDGSCTYVNVCGDADPPELVDFDFSPKTVDVTNGSVDVTCTATVTDDLSGVDKLYCYIVSPSGAGSDCWAYAPSSGDVLDGVWSCPVTIPQNAEQGAWRVAGVRVDDAVGNVGWYYTPDLQNLGFPTQLDVTSSSGGDADPPELVDFDFSPKTVDVTNGSVDVTCTATVTDDLSGVDKLYCYIVSPSGAGSDCWAYAPSSGDVLDGVWSCPVTIPQNAEQGAWRVAGVRVDDAVGNVGWYYTPDLQNLGFPTQLDVTSSSGGDADPPELVDFDFSPKTVDVTNGSVDVTCTATVTDDLSGVDKLYCYIVSPSGAGSDCWAYAPSSGDVLDGVWSCPVTIPQNAEQGAWRVAGVRVDDAVGNVGWYYTPDLQNLGFPTQLDVTSAGPDTDPPVITDFDIAPAQVDVSTEAQVVTCTFAVQDIGVGLDYAHCHLRSPSGQTTGCSASPGLPGQTVSGDRFNGVFHCDAWIALGSEPGEWFVSSILAYDRVNNQSSYPTSEMQSLGFPTQLDVTSAGPDTDPPVITDFDIAPAQVDVSTEAQVVTCTFAVQDIGVGLDYAHCHLRSPSGQTTGCSASPGLPGQTVSGDRFNGVFHCDAWIALGSEPGEWFVSSILAYDRVNNQSSYPTSEMQSLGFPTQLDVTSAGPDTDPPVITDFDIAPAQVDVSTEAQVVTCTFAVQDIGVGLDYAHCHLRSPSGQTTGCSASPGLPGQTVSGDRFNGVFHCDAWIALGSEPGEWFVSSILAYDRVNNQSSYPTSEMQSLGFPTQFEVTYGSGEPPP